MANTQTRMPSLIRLSKYPANDPSYNYAGAFEGPEACGTFKAPKVISTSYA